MKLTFKALKKYCPRQYLAEIPSEYILNIWIMKIYMDDRYSGRDEWILMNDNLMIRLIGDTDRWQTDD